MSTGTSKFKVLVFILIAGSIARISFVFAIDRTWTVREWGIAYMGLFTLLTGIVLLDEIRRSKTKQLDPFGDEALGPKTQAASLLREMDPEREENLIGFLAAEQPEALNELRAGRIVFSDLPFHDPAIVKAALRECSPEEVAKAIHDLDETLQACIRDWAGLPLNHAISGNGQPAGLRRKILESVESHYLQMGVHDFAAPLAKPTITSGK